MNQISFEQVSLAYRKLKQAVYYDKSDLCLRSRLAEFECSEKFEQSLTRIEKVVNQDTPRGSVHFKNWLRKIDYRVVPKLIVRQSNRKKQKPYEGKFITNVTSSEKYIVEKVNYFFEGPIELHIIAILWIMEEGWRLDKKIGPESYGSRLYKNVGTPDDNTARLYTKYHDYYSKWRDDGVKTADRLINEEKKSVCVIGLDLQEYYYRVRVDYDSIAHTLGLHSQSDQADELDSKTYSNKRNGLLNCVESINRVFAEKIETCISQTHGDFGEYNHLGLPIGLYSSHLLANWHLRDFDRAVQENLRPAYYGRYVDDILMVLPTLEDPSQSEDPIADFINGTFVKHGILQKAGDTRYELTNRRGLYLQQSKCILQFFDTTHSSAGLTKFKKKLEESVSAFRLLPVEEADNSLEDVSYDLLYEGSTNKFRSVKGMSENRYELAKHLAKQTMLHLLADASPNRDISLGLLNFFKGFNAVEFSDLWERVFTYFVITKDEKSKTAFSLQIEAELEKITHKSHSILEALIENLKKHLSHSRAMSEVLDSDYFGIIGDTAEHLRESNLMRHHFVKMPLVNFTNYSGSLITWIQDREVEIDELKLTLSPRHISLDEFVLLADSGLIDIGNVSPFEWASNHYEEAYGHSPEDVKILPKIVLGKSK